MSSIKYCVFLAKMLCLGNHFSFSDKHYKMAVGSIVIIILLAILLPYFLFTYSDAVVQSHGGKHLIKQHLMYSFWSAINIQVHLAQNSIQICAIWQSFDKRTKKKKPLKTIRIFPLFFICQMSLKWREFKSSFAQDGQYAVIAFNKNTPDTKW